MAPQLAKKLAIAFLVTLMALSMDRVGATGTTHKRFIIHVPMKVKSHHHTHTVYTHIHHGGGKVEYKVLGYSQQGLEGHGEIPKHALAATHTSGHAGGGGDIVFNHYARNGENQLEDEFASDYEDWDT